MSDLALRAGVQIVALCVLVACVGREPGPDAAGRAALNEEQAYVALQTLLRDNPGFRQGFVDSCADRLSERPQGDKSKMAGFLDVPEPLFETEFCTRVASLIASGRLSYADFAALRSHATDAKTIGRLLSLVITEPGGSTQI